MNVTIFGLVILSVLAVAIYDGIMEVMGIDVASPSYLLMDTKAREIYDNVILVTVVISIAYVVISAWYFLVFGNTIGFILK